MTIQTVITDRGRAILAGRVPGDPPLASIKIAVGDGNGNFPVPNPAQTMLVNERWRGDAQAALNGDKLGFVVTIPAAVGGWAIREVGVYVGPAGAEELLVASQFDGRTKPPAGENGASALTIVSAIDYSGSVVGAFNITLDADLAAADPNVFRVVVARLQHPPENATSDAVYAVAGGATGAWIGKGGQLARRKGTAWVFEAAMAGHVVRDGADALYQKSGADYVPYYPPLAVHDHDDRYYTEAEIATLLVGKSDVGHGHDGRYVMLNPPGGAGQAVAGAFGARIGANAYNVVEVGDTPQSSGFLATYTGAGVRVGFTGWWNGQAYISGWTDGATSVVLGANGAARLTITPDGATELAGPLVVSNSAGAAGQVLTSQGVGQPDQWRNVIDLITTPELRAKLGGGVVHASFSTRTFTPIFYGSPNNVPTDWQAVGCSVTAFTGSGHLYMDVTFGAPAPNAAYVVVGIPAVGISMRTVNGFRYDVGGGDSSTYNVNFSVII